MVIIRNGSRYLVQFCGDHENPAVLRIWDVDRLVAQQQQLQNGAGVGVAAEGSAAAAAVIATFRVVINSRLIMTFLISLFIVPFFNFIGGFC